MAKPPQLLQSSEVVAAQYAALHAAHGDGHQAVGWQSAHGQIAGFLQMAAFDGIDSGRPHILDLGCGLGDFKRFLAGRGVAFEYTGWDICEPLIARARERDPGGRYEVRDILAHPPTEQFDIVVASGTLNMRITEHEAWMHAMLRTMFGMCRRGMAFNLPSAYYAIDRPLHIDPAQFFYVGPEDVLAFCFGLSRQVALDHGSVAQSFAVYVYRDNPHPAARVAAEIAPGKQFGAGHRAVAEHFESYGMFAELIEYLESLEPTAEVLDRIGLAAFQLADERRQRSAFARAIELDPQAVAPVMHLAVTHLDSGQHAQAVPLLERARALDPHDPDLAYRLGRSYQVLGRLDEAQAAYRAALALAPSHRPAQAALADMGAGEAD